MTFPHVVSTFACSHMETRARIADLWKERTFSDAGSDPVPSFCLLAEEVRTVNDS
jgi:hypothetical protein